MRAERSITFGDLLTHRSGRWYRGRFSGSRAPWGTSYTLSIHPEFRCICLQTAPSAAEI